MATRQDGEASDRVRPSTDSGDQSGGGDEDRRGDDSQAAPKAEPAPDSEEDLEDRPTEQWAPVAASLFLSGERRPAAPAATPPGPQVEPEENDTERVAGDFLMQMAELGGAIQSPSVQAPDPARGSQEKEKKVAPVTAVSGELGAAARQAPAEGRARTPHPNDDSNATLVVDLPPAQPLDRGCRLCGRKISAPLSTRPKLLWARTAPVDQGYRCETCGNDFCASHVARASGLLESLVRGVRFQCPLCMPLATPPSRPR